MSVNQTHNPSLKSWVQSANEPSNDLPIQNLPFSVLKRSGSDEDFRIAVGIGDFALDLKALLATGTLTTPELKACQTQNLNNLIALGVDAWSRLRGDLSRLLKEDATNRQSVETCLIPLSEVEFTLPVAIGDYTDFFASIHHATNMGKLFRPDNPLLPNYEWVPIAYHGRSSSIGISGQRFPRPIGQLKSPDSDMPIVGASKRLDYELEVGIFVGPGNELGQPVYMDDAEDHVFGLCLLNDWSARDIQTWEYQPLGPFLAKSFASTISPWIVTLEALAPFRSSFVRDSDHPAPLPYLSSPANASSGAIDIELEVLIQTSQMRCNDIEPERLSRSNFKDSYWTIAQMITHHTMNGCNLRPGDLFGSGTMSGPAEGNQGALIEITRGGTVPLQLSNGEDRMFLEDGDTVTLRARCVREGVVTIGFGEAVGTVEAAKA